MKKLFLLPALLLVASPAYSQTIGTSAAVPSPVSSFSTTTGLFSPASGVVGVSSAGTEMMRVNGTGVGIGTTAPGTLLEISTGALTTSNLNVIQTSTSSGIYYAAYDLTNSNGIGGRIGLGGSNFSQPGKLYSPNDATFASFQNNAGIIIESLGSSSYIKLATSGDAPSNERMRIDSSGNVGIGTTAPDAILSLGGQSAQTIDMVRETTAGTAGNNLTVKAGGAVTGGTNLNGGALNLASGVSTGTGTSGINFKIYEAGSSGTVDNSSNTAMVITGAGLVGIGTTSPTATLSVNGSMTGSTITLSPSANYGVNVTSATSYSGMLISYAGNVASAMLSNDTTGGTGAQTSIYFYRNGTSVGTITTTNGATAYNQMSDRRVKKNITATSRGLAELAKITVSDFNYNSDPDGMPLKQGFIAQDLYKVYPEAVATNGDDGNKPIAKGKIPWGVDYGRLTPLLVKSVQELKAQNDSQAAELQQQQTEIQKQQGEIGELKQTVAQLTHQK